MRNRMETKVYARRKRLAGAAMLEATIVAPVLGVALIGTLFLHRWYAQSQHARVEARRCAWLHAMAGCGDRVPPGCDAYLTRGGRDSLGGAQRLRGIAQSSGSDVLSRVPLLGDALDGLFGTTTEAAVVREIKAPWQGERLQARGRVTLSCNTQPVDIGATIEKVFCDALPVVGCGG